MNVSPRIQAFCCPTCRGFIGEAAPIEEVKKTMTAPYAIAIINALSPPGTAVQRDTIVSAVYRGSRHPSDPAGVFSQELFRLRNKLRPFGWSIICLRGDKFNGGLYRLIPTEAGQ